MCKRASGAVDLAVLTIALLTVCTECLKAAEQELPPTSSGMLVSDDTPLELQLEVYVNGASTALIATLRQTPGGSLLIEPEQLKNVGIRPDKEAMREDGWIDLDRMSGVDVSYDEENQTLRIDAQENKRSTRVIDAKTGGEVTSENEENKFKAKSNFGVLVNYMIYGASGGRDWYDLTQFQGISSLMEGRLLGPSGVLSSSQAISSSDSDRFGSTRLDTRWSYSDPDSLMTYNVGDFITGGLIWTRPTRLGGVQIRRNFSLRPDLVTMPMPELSGSAAVPSTVDVYIDNTRRVTNAAASGPFVITNLPVVTGAGTARMVVRDVLGRETVTETPFYASADLLAKGLADFSAEAGFARRYYGTESNDYDGRIVASGTLRYGLTNNMTIEGHVDGAENFHNAGIGGVFHIGSFGVGTVSGATSKFGGETGYQVSGSVEAELVGIKFYLRTQRTFGDYNDIAAITADIDEPGLQSNSVKPVKGLDQVSVSLPPIFDDTNLNFSYAQIETAGSEKSRILGVTATRAIGERGNVFVSAYKDFEQKGSYGLYAGLSWSFDQNVTASTSVSADENGITKSVNLMKSEQDEAGSTGWRLRGSHGQSDIVAASGSYRSQFGRIEGSVEKYDENVRASAQIDGAVVLAGGGVFLSNRIDDAFGVVDVGAPDVDVEFENRPMGKTNKSGKMLLPTLRSYDKNVISIDPSNLPIDATVGETRQVVSPSYSGGAVVDFNVKADTQAALVTLRDESSAYIKSGSTARLNGSQEFIVGYDGQVYLEGIENSNTLIVTQAEKNSCQFTFNAPRKMKERVTIPDAVCRSTQ